MCWFISSKLYNFVLHDTSDVIVHLDTFVTVYMYISVWLYIGYLVLKKINWRKYKIKINFFKLFFGYIDEQADHVRMLSCKQVSYSALNPYNISLLVVHYVSH